MPGRNSLIVFMEQTKAVIFSHLIKNQLPVDVVACMLANLNVMGTVHAKLVLYSLDLHAFHAQKRRGLRNDSRGGGKQGAMTPLLKLILYAKLTNQL